jgi:hypothetical protein
MNPSMYGCKFAGFRMAGLQPINQKACLVPINQNGGIANLDKIETSICE